MNHLNDSNLLKELILAPGATVSTAAGEELKLNQPYLETRPGLRIGIQLPALDEVLLPDGAEIEMEIEESTDEGVTWNKVMAGKVTGVNNAGADNLQLQTHPINNKADFAKSRPVDNTAEVNDLKNHANIVNFWYRATVICTGLTAAPVDADGNDLPAHLALEY